MRTLLIILVSIISTPAFTQADTSKWLRAFPVTSYIVDLNDSTKLVQLHMPDGISIAEKQLAILQGVYNEKSDTARKGYGRCQLIKSDYYYFAIGHNTSGSVIKEGDLIYTFMPLTGIYMGRLPKLAAHFIELQNLYENAWYDRYNIFNKWSVSDEKTHIDSMAADIRFTGKHFKENNPSMDQDISSGSFKGKKVLSVMSDCKPKDVEDFLDYIIARPRLYAGLKWKISEIFASWVVHGAPMVVK